LAHRAERRAAEKAEAEAKMAPADSVWSYKIFTMSYSDGFSTVRPTTYGPFASKAECEKAKEGADWEQWHNVPGTGPTIEEKELYCQHRPNDVICRGTTKISPPTDKAARLPSECPLRGSHRCTEY
jgi:hypothetical protein